MCDEGILTQLELLNLVRQVALNKPAIAVHVVAEEHDRQEDPEHAQLAKDLLIVSIVLKDR